MGVMPKFTQENVLILLTWSSDHFEIARSIVDENLFDRPYYHKIAEKAINYIDKYHAPIGDHLPDELITELNDPKDGPTYQSLLNSLFNSKDSFNGKYILDKLTSFVKEQKFENALVEAFNLNRTGKKDEAYRKIEDALNFNISIFDPGLRLSNLSAGFSSEETDESFPIRIPELDKRDLGPVRKQFWLLIAGKNKGKAQPLTSKILTPHGWKLMGEIKVGDKHIGIDGKQYSIKNIFPQGKVDIYKVIFSDGSHVRCTGDHLWEVHLSTHHTTTKILSTRQIIKSGINFKNGKYQTNKYCVPTLENPVEYDNTTIPLISMYTIGALLGDGGLANGKDVTITNIDQELLDFIRNDINKFGLSLNQVESQPETYYISGVMGRLNPVTAYLRKLGLCPIACENKFIPDELKTLSSKYRLELLQGLLDTDGSPKINKGVGFGFELSSKSNQLVIDALEIVQSLGGKGRISTEVKSCTYKGEKRSGVYYRLHGRLPNTLSPFKISRKVNVGHFSKKTLDRSIKSIELAGNEEAQCIVTDAPRQLYITDGFIPTHNSMSLTHIGKMGLMSGSKVLHITLELSRGQIFRRYVQSILGLTKDRADSIVQSPLFEKDANGYLKSYQLETIYPKSLQDDAIYPYMEEQWKLFGQRLDNLIIAEFPTNALTIRGLNGHLDLLEKRENFIPDEILIDYANLMSFDKENYRIELGQLIQDLRGIAVKRNAAVATAAQLNRAGLVARVPGIWNAAEDISQVSTADTVCVYAQTPQELKYKRARLTVTSRNSKSQFTLLLAQNYDICNWCLDSVMMPYQYKIPGSSEGEDTDDKDGEILTND